MKGKKTKENGGNSNNLYTLPHTYPCTYTPSTTPARLKLALPCPQLDQIQISLFSLPDNPPVDVFAKEFGTYHSQNCSWWTFDNGISVSRYSRCFYYVISFQYTEALFDRIFNLLKEFPQRRCGKPAAQLRSAEIAWDIPLEGMCYREAEKILRDLAEHAIPSNKYAQFFYKPGDMQKTRDGATNGKLTAYYNKNSKATWKAKMYPKKYDGIWHIRCEVTLQGQALESRLGKSIGTSTIGCVYLQRVTIHDFWTFGEVIWDDFASKVNSMTKNFKRNKRTEIGKLLQKGYKEPMANQDAIARQIMRAIGSKRFKEKYSKKAFIRQIHYFK